MEKTLYVNLGGEEIASDGQVEVVKVDLDFNFWLYLGEQLSLGLRIESRSALLSRFVEECPEAAEPLLAAWEKLKELVFGDSPSGSVPVMLGNDYFQWLKFSDMPQSVRDRYRDREELTLNVDVAELAEIVLDDVKRILRRSIDDTIEEVVFNHPAVTRRSPLVRYLKKCNEDFVFVPFDRWQWHRAAYKVGNYYNENGKEGIVFEVDASGRHGKIVALHDLSEGLAWCDDPCSWGVLIGANDKEDGMKNMEAVRKIPDWQKKFPAFAGCAALGEDWYLPAYDEWKKIYVNRDSLPNFFSVDVYWSSSENNSDCAWGANLDIGGARDFGKFYQYRVRAVATF